MPLIEKHYIGLRRELKEAGKFLNKRALAKLSKTVPALADVVIDIKYIEDYLHESLGPTTSEEREHAEVVDEIVTRLLRGNVTSELLTQAALLRKSLG